MDKEFEKSLNKFGSTIREIREQNEYLNSAAWYADIGNDIVYPQLKASWTNFVRESITDKTVRLCMEDIVKIMQLLDKNQDMSKALEVLNNGDNSGASYGLIVNYVAEFSKRGPEFGRAALGKSCNQKWEDYFKSIEERNAQYESELNDNKEIE